MKSKKLAWVLLLAANIFGADLALASGEVKADLFEIGKDRKDAVFILSQDVDGQPDGHQVIKAIFSDKEGNPVLLEEATLENGKVVKNSIAQNQTKEKGVIEVKDGMIYFSKTKDGGKEETASEKLREPLLIPAAFAHFVKSNWETLAKGEAAEFRFAVWHRLETVGFQFKKVRDEGEGDSKVLILKLKPTSFIISALVDPLVFKYSYKNQRIISYEGRVAPKIKKGTAFKDFDAEVVYKFLD